jgi:transmembrane sensor
VDKFFNSIEEVIADDHFCAWYFKTDPAKAKEWEEWLGQHPQYTALVQEATAWLSELTIGEKELPAAHVEQAHDRLMHELKKAPVVELKSSRRRWWIPAAAAIFILIVAGGIFWKQTNNKTTLNSDYGTISEYRLPDGSHVMLNANSKITINKEWEKGTDREVWLEGEAFFKVQKTPAKNRFIVHASAMDIIVTGTQFNAVARDDESSVLLTEGSVTIKTADGKEIKMKPGDFVKVENKTPAKQPVDQERVLAWKGAKLDFDKTPMYEVAKIISRHYGIKVNISDKSIGESTISGIMPNDNLDVLIQALEATGDYKITRANNEIVISGP